MNNGRISLIDREKLRNQFIERYLSKRNSETFTLRDAVKIIDEQTGDSAVSWYEHNSILNSYRAEVTRLTLAIREHNAKACGTWIVEGDCELKCSVCGTRCPAYMEIERNFCQFCGSDMRGNEIESDQS